MASKRKKDQDRVFMDAAGAPPAATKAEAADFMHEKADEDRTDAKIRHADKGLRSAKETLATMVKAVAHGLASDSDAVKAACLEEVADLGNAVRDGCRAALRAAKTEKRNVQA